MTTIQDIDYIQIIPPARPFVTRQRALLNANVNDALEYFMITCASSSALPPMFSQ